MSNEYGLLKELCGISAPSSDESRLANFILEYVEKNSFSWRHKPRVVSGEDYQDCVMLVWGNPRTAMIAHIDSVGFMVGYGNSLLPVGTPRCPDGSRQRSRRGT